MLDCCKGITPQEEWMDTGNIPKEGRERAFKINSEIRKHPTRLDINRARLFTESFKTTEGENISLRWGKALVHIAKNIPICIGEDEILVGKSCGTMARSGILYPEVDGPYLLCLEKAHERSVSPFTVSEEDFKIIEEEIYPYWKDRSYAQVYASALPDETRNLIFGEDKTNFSKQQFVVSQTTTARSSLNYNFELEHILQNGLGKLKAQAQQKVQESLTDPAKYVEEGPFWEASALGLEALIIFIDRYAKEAARLANMEINATRKAELLQIAENCEWITTEPAKDFRTALQLQWFVLLFARLEQNVGGALGTTRMDQHLLPYYHQDIANGTITNAQVKELFECYWLNLSQILILIISDSTAKLFEGYAHFETVTIGGQTKNGEDATNELSYLILESKRGFPIPYPDLAARIHARTPEKFIRACAEVIKDGQGFPKLFNDEEIVPLYIAKGATMEEALDYAVSGCTETRIVNRETYINGCASVNLGAIMELTMNNGRLKILGNKQIGFPTPDAKTFDTYETFFNAFKQQYEYIIHHVFIQQMVADKVKPTKLAAPLSSFWVGACRDSSKDINDYVPNSIREMFLDKVGYATVIDAIAAVKKLVFEEKKISMSDLVDAINANFEGYEPLRQQLLHAPKYGNNEPYADAIGKEVDKITMDYLAKHRGLHGEQFSDRIVPVTSHIPTGMVVGATPDGRKAGHYLSEGTSASHGAELSGPTAILLSNKEVKNAGYKERAARLLNVKLSPATLVGEEGTKKLVSFIRTWCDLKLWHIQFNVINRTTLEAAQKEPEKYKDLIVRVAGYSAYFTELSPTLQQELIERAEHTV